METKLPRYSDNVASVTVREDNSYVLIVVRNNNGTQAAAALDGAELDDLITMLQFYQTRMDE